MAEVNMKFTGWQVVLVLVVVIGIVAVQIVRLSDKKDDSALMQDLKVQLVCDYFPNEVDKLRAAVDSGDADRLDEVAKSVTTAKLDIESVQASYPLLDFSTPKEVVVKVTYSLDDASGTRDRKTKYYLYTHGSIANMWRYEHETGAVRYYLNFL